MAKANQKFHHPMDMFNKIKVLPRKEINKIERKKKQRTRAKQKRINQSRFNRKGKKGRTY